MNPVVFRSLIAATCLSLAVGCGASTVEPDPDEAADRTDVFSLAGVTGGRDPRAVAIDGGFVYGDMDVNGVTTVTRVDDKLEPVWAVTVGGVGNFSSVNVDSEGRIVVIGQAGYDPARIVRLNGDGTLDTAVKTPDRIFVNELVALSEGRMMFNDTTLVDADFQVVSRGNGPGERIVAIPDGYLVLHREGLRVRRLDEEGRMRWETNVTVPRATYYTIGIRMLEDGTILAAVSGDVTAGNVLITAHLDADGNVLAVNNPRFETKDADGYSVPLQFGRGIQMTQHGDKTYVSFIANSGGLGSDVRTQIAAELDETGAVTHAFFGGGGLTMLGNRLISARDSIIATNTMTSTCLSAPTFSNKTLEPEGKITLPTSILPDISDYDFTPLTTVTVTPVDVTAERTCRAPQ